jgi:NitT/TauT family transport system substrate-binding protein
MAQDKVRLQTDWIPSGEHAMHYGAWSKGIYAKHGIDITITRGYGSGDTVTKLAGGASDFGIADVSAVFTARQEHCGALQPVTALAVCAQELGYYLFQGP